MNEQQFKRYLESQVLWRREGEQKRSDKDYLNDLFTNMIKTDGGNIEEFRRWANKVHSNAAMLQDNGAAVQLMLRTTLGSLKDETDRCILEFVKLNTGKSRLDVNCVDLLNYLRKSFLPNNDIDVVRESLDTLRQSPRESLRAFNRKYRDLAEVAFPVEQRFEDQTKLLIKSYIKSLSSRDTVRATLQASPTNLAEAVATAQESDELEDTLQRLGHRLEEPMDISSVKPNIQTQMPWDRLSKQLDKMNNNIARLETQIDQGWPAQMKYPQGRQMHGKTICFRCSNTGNIARPNCPRKSQNSNNAMDVSSVPPTIGMNQENF